MRSAAKKVDSRASLPDEALDRILATQILVAWAGEGRCVPPRLGWWRTDLIDEYGGGDFMARLLPKTHAWAALEAVREAARRVDAAARARMADGDRMRSLFFLGFDVDEQLKDRFHALKMARWSPVLPLPGAAGSFSRESLAAALQGPDVSFTVVPGGRHLSEAPPAAVDELVELLAAALVPFAESYPLPFVLLEQLGAS